MGYVFVTSDSDSQGARSKYNCPIGSLQKPNVFSSQKRAIVVQRRRELEMAALQWRWRTRGRVVVANDNPPEYEKKETDGGGMPKKNARPKLSQLKWNC